MLQRYLQLTLVASATLLLVACASKPVTHADEPPYAGPKITLHPAPGAAALASIDPQAQQTALGYINDRRAELGLLPIASDDMVAEAAAAHARYLDINRANGHDERADLPGFTGVDVTARVRARTAVQIGAGEIFAIYGGAHPPAQPIDEIFASPYHRGAILYDWARAGEAALNGNSSITVVDFADAAPIVTATELVAYPYPNQPDAPVSWTDNEIPDPFGVDSGYRGALVGFPITLSGGTNGHIDVLGFDLLDSRGKKVRCKVGPQTPASSGRNTAVCTPFQPLTPGAHYTAHVRGRLTQQYGAVDVPFDLTWTFSTLAPRTNTASASGYSAYH